MATRGVLAQTYYGSEEEDEPQLPGPSQQFLPVQEQIVQQPQVAAIPFGGDALTLILQRINDMSMKMDNMISRIASLEQSNRSILDTVMEMKRSFPKYTTLPTDVATHFDRRLA